MRSRLLLTAAALLTATVAAAPPSAAQAGPQGWRPAAKFSLGGRPARARRGFLPSSGAIGMDVRRGRQTAPRHGFLPSTGSTSMDFRGAGRARSFFTVELGEGRFRSRGAPGPSGFNVTKKTDLGSIGYRGASD